MSYAAKAVKYADKFQKAFESSDADARVFLSENPPSDAEEASAISYRAARHGSAAAFLAAVQASTARKCSFYIVDQDSRYSLAAMVLRKRADDYGSDPDATAAIHDALNICRDNLDDPARRYHHDPETRKTLESDWRRPLHMAVSAGNVELVRRILAQGANPNGYDNENDDKGRPFPDETPLSAAVAAGHFEIAKILAEAGADPNTTFALKDKGTIAPSGPAKAAADGDWAMVRMLKSSCKRDPVCLHDDIPALAKPLAMNNPEPSPAASEGAAKCWIVAQSDRAGLFAREIKEELDEGPEEPPKLGAFARLAARFSSKPATPPPPPDMTVPLRKKLILAVNDAAPDDMDEVLDEIEKAACSQALKVAKRPVAFWAVVKAVGALDFQGSSASPFAAMPLDDSDPIRPARLACLRRLAARAELGGPLAADLKAGFAWSETALEGLGLAHIAVLFGQAGVLEILAGAGAPLKAEGSFGIADPAFVAARSGKSACFEILDRLGAVDYLAPPQSHPFHGAILGGFESLAFNILEKTPPEHAALLCDKSLELLRSAPLSDAERAERAGWLEDKSIYLQTAPGSASRPLSL